MSPIEDNLYHITILDAKYDHKEKMIVCFAFFKELETNRIMIYDLKNMTYNGKKPVPKKEAIKTVELFNKLKGKEIKWSILDSPNIKNLTDEEMKNVYEEFTKEVDKTMSNTVDELKDEDKQLERKIAGIIRKEKGMEERFQEIFGA